jgi:hypothetical protein
VIIHKSSLAQPRIIGLLQYDWVSNFDIAGYCIRNHPNYLNKCWADGNKTMNKKIKKLDNKPTNVYR